MSSTTYQIIIGILLILLLPPSVIFGLIFYNNNFKKRSNQPTGLEIVMSDLYKQIWDLREKNKEEHIWKHLVVRLIDEYWHTCEGKEQILFFQTIIKRAKIPLQKVKDVDFVPSIELFKKEFGSEIGQFIYDNFSIFDCIEFIKDITYYELITSKKIDFESYINNLFETSIKPNFNKKSEDKSIKNNLNI